MPVTKLSDLTSAGSLASGDLFYVVQTAGVGGKKATLSQLATLLGSSFLGLTAQAADSAKLGGTAAASFLLASTAASTYQTQSGMSAYQLALVSGTSIKTVGGVSLLGSGDVSVGGGGDMLLGTAQEVTAAKTFDVSTLLLKGSTSGTSTLNAAAVAGTTTFTLPGSSGTLALLSDIPSLSGYETTSHASSTYQTLAGMSGYLTTSGTAADSSKLGGTAAASYLLASTAASTYLAVGATAADSSKLGGVSAASYALTSDLSPYLTSATAASTYQTQAGMSSYLTTASAASTYLALSGGTLTGSLTLTVGAANTGVLESTGYSLTGSNATSMVNLAGTLNTSGSPSVFKLSITNTGSGSSTRLLDFYWNGSRCFDYWPSQGLVTNYLGGFLASFSGYSTLYGNLGISISSIAGIGFSSAHNPGNTYGSNDTILYRDAAGTLAQRNGANAQTLRTYRSYTDLSNYSRLTHGWNTTTALVMAEGAGTGSDGSVAFNDAALATNATVGFIMIPSCAGTPSGTPADIPTGQIPLVWDSTNLKLYAYTGGAWKSSAAFT